MKTLNDLIDSTKGMNRSRIDEVVTQHLDESIGYLQREYSSEPHMLLNTALGVTLTSALAKIHELTRERDNLERLLRKCNTQFTELLKEHS